eukprot:gene23665-9197_t
MVGRSSPRNLLTKRSWNVLAEQANETLQTGHRAQYVPAIRLKGAVANAILVRSDCMDAAVVNKRQAEYRLRSDAMRDEARLY